MTASMQEAILRNRVRQADLRAQHQAFVLSEIDRFEKSGAVGYKILNYRDWLSAGLAKPTESLLRS